MNVIVIVNDQQKLRFKAVKFLGKGKKTILEKTIDYRCEDDHFPASASCVTISRPHTHSSSETRVNPRIRS
jgi:hypothetical protein